eukprot:1179983-Prorocentrum_minimum.AAC.7
MFLRSKPNGGEKRAYFPILHAYSWSIVLLQRKGGSQGRFVAGGIDRIFPNSFSSSYYTKKGPGTRLDRAAVARHALSLRPLPVRHPGPSRDVLLLMHLPLPTLLSTVLLPPLLRLLLPPRPGPLLRHLPPTNYGGTLQTDTAAAGGAVCLHGVAGSGRGGRGGRVGLSVGAGRHI